MSEYAKRPDDLEGIKQTAEKYGFCIVKGLFSAERMREMEALMAEEWKRGTSRDLMSSDQLRPVILDDKILRIANALLGKELVYYGETSMNYEPEAGKIANNPFRTLHADARGTPADINKTWDPAPGQVYRGYRFGIYFRDYTRYSGGLKVAPGSHHLGQTKFKPPRGLRNFFGKHRVDLPDGSSIKIPTASYELYDIASEPGDLVIFSLRVFHSAGAARLKQNPNYAMHPAIENDLWKSQPDLFHPYPSGGRNTLFFDYAAPGEEIDLYIKWRAWRSYNSGGDNVEEFNFDDERIVREAAAKGISMRFDKIMAKALKAKQNERLEKLKANNREFSQHHSFTAAS